MPGSQISGDGIKRPGAAFTHLSKVARLSLLRNPFTTLYRSIICSVAVDLRLSNIVDLPNVTVSAFLPEDIFTDRG